MALTVTSSVLDLIGNTPILRLLKLSPSGGGEIWAKLEHLNPGGSLKDRTALGMIRDAEARGLISPAKSTIIEPTAGNTGVGLALCGVQLGYRVIAVMPESYSVEKQILIEALGGQVVRTPAADGMTGAVAKAESMAASTPGGFLTRQFSNPANPEIHYLTTGPEIWEQTGGNLSALVIGAGTGGSFTGTARFLKEKSPALKCYLVEGQGSVLGGGKPGYHLIEGIGNAWFPKTLDMSLTEKVLTVSDRQALAMLKRLAREEGLLVGGSSGAVAHGALEVARELPPGQRVVCLLADPAERYMSKRLHQREE
ncbi:MAG: cysteine synthase family protein [Candidatus Riflebacteria bacterium]|nr:cysteine synthase family protein [Candidatus Riflebacteria bacterium]